MLLLPFVVVVFVFAAAVCLMTFLNNFCGFVILWLLKSLVCQLSGQLMIGYDFLKFLESISILIFAERLYVHIGACLQCIEREFTTMSETFFFIYGGQLEVKLRAFSSLL